MSINSYLESLASNLVVKDSEKNSISKSLETLKKRLYYYFMNEIKEDFCFGSYTRGTILPRKADANSDIDYMIVFNNPYNLKPQTILNKLREFAKKYYSSSEIYQSFPTLVLNLNHIRFELVPSCKGVFFLDEYKIPAPSSNYEDWISTDPNGFNNELVQANKNNKNKIKPVIRLIKYWNTINGKVYSSYELEMQLIKVYYSLSNSSILDYFEDAVNSLPTYYGQSEVKKDTIIKFKATVKDIITDYLHGYPITAENKLKSLLPPI